MTKKQKKVLIRILCTAALMIGLAFVPVTGWLRLWLYLIPYLIIGYDILRKAALGLWHLQPFDENFLMAVATLGAMALGEYTEGAAVMLFYQIGELFQSVAVGKSRKSIRALLDLRPDGANLIDENGNGNGNENENQNEDQNESGDGTQTVRRVSPEEVPVGSLILVRPGERVPLDGVLLTGETRLDTAALTGESVPHSVRQGDEVPSGCINLTDAIRLRTTKPYGESTVARILSLMESAGSRKSRSEDFIARFARIYTPAVCLCALLLALVPPLLRSLWLGLTPGWSDWLYRALTFLVISCPCALVISIPLTFFAAMGGASRAGVLVKGSGYMETLAKVRTAVFDKTGTLTEGVFQVTRVSPVGMEEKELLTYAALAESQTTHPIGRSLMAAWGQTPDPDRVKDITEISGCGVTAIVDGVSVAVGNRRLVGDSCPEEPADAHAGTVVYVTVDGRFAGYILISDRIKQDAPETVQALKRVGVRQTVLLTGDREAVGEAVARELGMDKVFCELLPGDKVARLEELLSRPQTGKLAFVGDGINDAPVLVRADVGIAMGALGSDAAIEAADVVLMNDRPSDVVRGMAICRKALRIVYENITFALCVKALCLILGAVGLADMWLAIFADVGVMVLAVLNAIRALR